MIEKIDRKIFRKFLGGGWSKIFGGKKIEIFFWVTQKKICSKIWSIDQILLEKFGDLEKIEFFFS